MNPHFIATGLMWYVVFLFSLTCHEAAHALAAKLGGDLTAFRGGQATLNPIPHIRREPFGTVIVPILSFALGGWMIGWGSAPYDPGWKFRFPRRAAWMALAGPLANIVLFLTAAGLIRLGIFAGVLEVPTVAGFTHVVAGFSGTSFEGLAVLLSIMFSLNLLLAAFNLLPVPPLDGNTAVGIFLSDKSIRRFDALSRNQTLAIIGLIASWKLFGYIFVPLFRMGLGLLYWGASGF